MLSEKLNGYFDFEHFRGFSLIASNELMVSELISTILKNNLTYNFVVRRVGENLQFIFFIRHCKILEGVEDLNLDAGGLSGYIVTTDKLNIDENILSKYLDTTNRKEDYILISSQFKSGGRRRPKTQKIKNKLFRKTIRNKK
jgi:hypothetical protein